MSETFSLCAKKISSGLFKNVIDKMCSEIIYSRYMFEKDLALNNQQWLICHITKPSQIYFKILSALNDPPKLISHLTKQTIYGQVVGFS